MPNVYNLKTSPSPSALSANDNCLKSNHQAYIPTVFWLSPLIPNTKRDPGLLKWLKCPDSAGYGGTYLQSQTWQAEAGDQATKQTK